MDPEQLPPLLGACSSHSGPYESPSLASPNESNIAFPLISLSILRWLEVIVPLKVDLNQSAPLLPDFTETRGERPLLPAFQPSSEQKIKISVYSVSMHQSLRTP